jgi:hypothetical protein
MIIEESVVMTIVDKLAKEATFENYMQENGQKN